MVRYRLIMKTPISKSLSEIKRFERLKLDCVLQYSGTVSKTMYSYSHKTEAGLWIYAMKNKSCTYHRLILMGSHRVEAVPCIRSLVVSRVDCYLGAPSRDRIPF